MWHIENFSITPENLNGFMDEAKNILQDDEAIAEWRKEIIASFRTASYGHNAKVDFNIRSFFCYFMAVMLFSLSPVCAGAIIYKAWGKHEEH